MTWLVCIACLVGTYLISLKNRIGWVLMAFQNIYWIVYFVQKQEIAFIVLNVIFLFLDINGFIKWGKNGKVVG